MRIEQLMYLVDIAQTQSISRTAQNFYITQQGVSDAIKKFEKEFDVTLIQRTKYGVILTQMGQFFVEEGQKMLTIYQGLIDKAETAHNSALSTLSGDLMILAHARIYQNILPSVTQLYCQHCPQVKLHIIESNSNDTIDSYHQQNSIDFGLITVAESTFNTPAFHAQYTRAQLTLEQLFVDDMVVCAPHDSPLLKKNSLTAEDLATIPVIAYEYESKSFANRPANSTYFTSNNIDVHRKFVQQGLAVDVMTKFEFQQLFQQNPDFIAIPLKKERMIIALIVSTNNALTPEATHYINLLRKFKYS